MMNKPKLLVLDIETSPHISYHWRTRDENIAPSQFIVPSRIISVGAKWHGERRVFYWDVFPHDDAAQRGEMLANVHELMAEADGVITFNGAKFDLPRLNGEFLRGRFAPLPPRSDIDVHLTTRKMGYASGRLEYVAPLLGCGKKLDTGGFDLWKRYMEGSDKARREMREYNIRDVKVLESLFDRVRPWIKPFPRFYDGPACPDCGGRHSEHRGYRRTRMFKIERLHCLDCGRWYDGKGRKA